MLAASLTTETGAGIADVWAGLVLLFAVVPIVYRVLSFGTVTIQSIDGALSAYLITGLMFAGFFAALDALGGGHFFASGQPATTQTFQYFSFTTLTTLGYDRAWGSAAWPSTITGWPRPWTSPHQI